MQKKNIFISRLSWLWNGAIGLMILVSAGCEPYDLFPEDSGELEAGQQFEQQAEVPALPEAPAMPETPVPVVPPAEPPPPPVSYSSFLWEPRSNSIRVVIPGNVAHHNFNLFTRGHHFDLYGPDGRGGDRNVDIEYILPGGPGVWAEKANRLDVSSGSELLVYVNTRDGQATGHKSAGWRILDPYQTYRGDGGTRLQRGENH